MFGGSLSARSNKLSGSVCWLHREHSGTLGNIEAFNLKGFFTELIQVLLTTKPKVESHI